MNEQRNPKGEAKPQATIQTVEPELGGVEKMADAPLGLDFEWPENVWVCSLLDMGGRRTQALTKRAYGGSFLMVTLNALDMAMVAGACPSLEGRQYDMLQAPVGLLADACYGDGLQGLIVVDEQGQEIARRYVR